MAQIKDSRIVYAIDILNRNLGMDFRPFGSLYYKDTPGDLDIAVVGVTTMSAITKVHNTVMSISECVIDSADSVKLYSVLNNAYDTKYLSCHKFHCHDDMLLPVNLLMCDNIAWIQGASMTKPTPGIDKCNKHVIMLQSAITTARGKQHGEEWYLRNNGIFQCVVRSNRLYNIKTITTDITLVPEVWGLNCDYIVLHCLGEMLQVLSEQADPVFVRMVLEEYSNHYAHDLYENTGVIEEILMQIINGIPYFSPTNI